MSVVCTEVQPANSNEFVPNVPLRRRETSVVSLTQPRRQGRGPPSVFAGLLLYSGTCRRKFQCKQIFAHVTRKGQEETISSVCAFFRRESVQGIFFQSPDHRGLFISNEAEKMIDHTCFVYGIGVQQNALHRVHDPRST